VPHLYGYLLPLKIGDSYYALGLFAKAEEYYSIALNYEFLNLHLEAFALWIRIARNILDWGSALYKQEDVTAAKVQYERIIKQDGTHPIGSILYSEAPLTNPSDSALTFIHCLNRSNQF